LDIAEQAEERVNEQIRIPRVRVIGDDGNNLGVMETRDALRLAQEKQLDLVEVAPGADPPVCRIMDYGKYLYSKKKRERSARMQQKQIEVKEIRLHPKTGDHHFDIKVKNAREWLKKGMKVKVRIAFRGREITYPELGRELLIRVAKDLSEVGFVEQEANMDGKTMLMVIAPGTPEKKKQ
jgi:translation initiation factor IF-3